MITSYATDKDVKTAYIIKKKQQLEKLNKIFGTAETVYPHFMSIYSECLRLQASSGKRRSNLSDIRSLTCKKGGISCYQQARI